jgi:hypothetical protein
MNAAVRFEHRGDHYAVSFKYDAGIVEILKALPSYARRWDPDRKLWRVDVGYARSLAGNLRELGYVVVGIEPPREPPRTNGRTIDGADWAHTLLHRVGPERRERVFRGLSKLLHPDVGGDTVLMRELNAAREQLGGNR